MGTKTKAAFSFAHLLNRAGIGAGAAAADDGQDQDDERKQRDGESDEDYAKRMEELDKKDQGDGKDDAGAEGDDDDPEAAGEDDKEKAARARERARCAAIFGSKAAASRPDVAAHLAFNTSMGARAAIGMLDAFAAGGAPAAAAPSRQSLASRMSGVRDQNIGASAAAAPASPAQATANMILAAGKARRGEA